MLSFEKWVSLAWALGRVRRNARALFVVYLLLDAVWLAGFCGAFALRGEDVVWPYIAMLMGMVPVLLSPYLLCSYLQNKRGRFSAFAWVAHDMAAAQQMDDALLAARRAREGVQDAVWAWENGGAQQPAGAWRPSAPFAAVTIGPRLAATPKALYGLVSSYYIPVAIPAEEMVWVYLRHRRYGGRRMNPNLFVVTRDGATHKLPLGGKLLLLTHATAGPAQWDALVLGTIQRYFPQVLVGDTADTREWYRRWAAGNAPAANR